MGTYKNFTAADIKASPSSLNQLIDVIQEDLSGSLTRRKYEVFVTGGIGPGITSSLFQTVYDQDFTLQTANPVFDMTVGLFSAGTTVTSAPGYQVASTGKLLFASQSVMMREKVDNYKQFASFLLGNADSAFYLGASAYPDNSGATTAAADRIDNALFVNYKRLFARDRIRKETFAMRFYTSASISGGDGHVGSVGSGYAASRTNRTGSNVAVTSEEGVEIFADIGANTDSRRVPGGDVARLKMASNITVDVGLMFYDYGVAVFDLSKICWSDQHISGTISAMNSQGFRHNEVRESGTSAAADVSGPTIPAGLTVIGNRNPRPAPAGEAASVGTNAAADGGRADSNSKARFIPDFMVSASIDNIIDHIGSTRISSGTLTSMAFQNQTNIQSSIYFCRAAPGEFNYSTNPTYIDANGNLQVIEDQTDPTERSFTFITTVGLYNANNEVMAVGKLSRPIEKNDEKDLTIRVRLDF